MAVDIVTVVDKLAEFGFIRPNKIIINYYSIYCPFHSGGQERKPSCGILLHDEYRNNTRYRAGWLHCFSCGTSKDLNEFVTDLLKQKSIQKSGFDWLKENIPGFEDEFQFEYLIPQDLMESVNNKFALDYIREKKQDTVEYVSEEELASYRFTVPYMYERKLTDEVIAKYDIGYDANFIPPGRKKPVPCITFPVRDEEGRTLFFCRRSIVGKMYSLPSGVTKPVFGLDMIPRGTTSVIVCESIINALTAVVYGYQAVALLGTGNSYQMQQLKRLGCNEFVLCMDGDDAGRRATEKLRNQLRSVAIVWSIQMPDGKDLNDVDKETFDKLYQEKE